ncbi:hypothetical protein LCI18_001938 [Fusarium solani-melongenae]|uniref:Uncharacterized protein n=1 Tax=Fusarium solani subsp. cucurbitae TaxID=2747967 RepID=A0ACD3YQ61_FUSSC|nr:hypothetical protein LCI18_001938 [Fusarium solani-melongenae]
MAPQPSFPPYEVSLVSIKSSNQILTSDNTDPSYYSQEPKVLHLNNSGESSFIGLEYLQNLHAAEFGSDKALPEIDPSTEVQLRSRFVGVDEAQVTTHRVLYAPQYDIIFIRHDWERLVQQCWARLNSEPKSGHQSKKKRSSQKKPHKQHQATQRRRHAQTLRQCNTI